MKKFLIIVLIIPIFLIAGCLDNYVPREEYNSKLSELEEANSKTKAKSKEILELKEELNLTEEELEQYRNLIANLNEIFKNVYYGYASSDNWIADGFTAFTIEYEGNFYLITAGHCVYYKYGSLDCGVYTYFKFRRNLDNKWIYPKLLAYENDYVVGRDYAIFYSSDITNGFTLGEYTNKKFVLGSTNNDLNVFRELYTSSKDGESGSPIINTEGQVIGIFTGLFTPIERVTEAIDNLE